MREYEEIEGMNEDQLTHGQIEKRAYEIYLQHSGEQGRALEDWLLAEDELRQEERSQREPILQRRTQAIG